MFDSWFPTTKLGMYMITMIAHDQYLSKWNETPHWYDKGEVARLAGYREPSEAKYYLDKAAKLGLVERKWCQEHPNCYSWYVYRLVYPETPVTVIRG
jgi:hypothetical protein